MTWSVTWTLTVAEPRPLALSTLLNQIVSPAGMAVPLKLDAMEEKVDGTVRSSRHCGRSGKEQEVTHEQEEIGRLAMTWHLRLDDGHADLPEINVENACGGPAARISYGTRLTSDSAQLDIPHP